MKLLTTAGSIAKKQHGCSGEFNSLCDKTKIRSGRRKNGRDAVKSGDGQKNHKWEPISGHQTRAQVVGGSMLVVNWMRGQWKIKDWRYRTRVHRLHNVLDETNILPMSDHSDFLHHTFREWHEGADAHRPRREGSSCRKLPGQACSGRSFFPLPLPISHFFICRGVFSWNCGLGRGHVPSTSRPHFFWVEGPTSDPIFLPGATTHSLSIKVQKTIIGLCRLGLC